MYFLVSLLEMSEWGGTNAESLKAGIDSIFDPVNGKIPLGDYQTKLVSCTADGASVNFGHISGLLTRIGRERNWLLKIHCSNHRIELAVKSAFKDSKFEELDEFYQANFSILKNSGKLKSMVRQAASALGIQFYELSRLTGTRFVGHRFEAFQRLLNMWPAFLTAYGNCLNDQSCAKIKPKVQGLLNKFRSYRRLCLTCTYLDVLDKIRPASKVFEGNGLLAYEIKPTIDLTLVELEDCMNDAGSDHEFLDSHLSRFRLKKDDLGINTLSSEFVKEGDVLKPEASRSMIQFSFDEMHHLNNESRVDASDEKRKVLANLSALLKDRFQDFNHGIYATMNFFDPKNWTDKKDYGNDAIVNFAAHFQSTLASAGYDSTKALREWRMLRNYVKVWLSNVPNEELWKKIIAFKKQEFPNVCLLAEILISISGSNSSVERAFSMLTNMLSDKRLSMKHGRMESILITGANDKNWSTKEREEIIERAVEIYLEKRRKRTVSSLEPPKKVARRFQSEETETVIVMESDEESVISNVSSESSVFYDSESN